MGAGLSAWGGSWGSSWGNSWGSFGTEARRTGDAGVRRHFRAIIVPEPEKQRPVLRRRKITRRIVDRALATADDLAVLLSPSQAMAVLPKRIEYVRPPSTDLSDDQLLIRAIVSALRIEKQRAAEDEELAIVLALAS